MAVMLSKYCERFKIDEFKEEVIMSLHLRSAVDKLKDYYIQHLIKTRLTNESEKELKKLSLTELKNLINGC
jgi:hypothetical protein